MLNADNMPIPGEKMTEKQREDWLNSDVVNNCICSNISFVDVLECHKQTGKPLEEIMKGCGVGTECEVCIPYMRAVLRTGKTEIPMDSKEVGWEISPGQGVPKEDLRKEGLIHKPLPPQHAFKAQS